MSREEHRITEKQEGSNGGDAKHPLIREEGTQDLLRRIDFPGRFL